jgi:hypothetical protein
MRNTWRARAALILAGGCRNEWTEDIAGPPCGDGKGSLLPSPVPVRRAAGFENNGSDAAVIALARE